MWGLLGILMHDSSVWARRLTACVSIPNCFPLHDERVLGAINDGSWIESNVTMISQKNHKIKKPE